jgi:proliferating cell nuclear antigen PCNA
MILSVTHLYPDGLFKIFDSLSGLLTDIQLLINKDSIQMSQMDSSQICLTKLELSCEDFESYQCNENHIQIGLSLKYFTSILKAGKKSNKIVISMKDTDNLNIQFYTQSDSKEYTLKLLDIQNELLEIPDMDPWCEFTVTPYLYNDILESAAITETQSLKIINKNNTLVFKSNGEIGTSNQVFKSGSYSEKKRQIVIKKDGDKISTNHFSANNKSYILSCGENNAIDLEFSMKMLLLFKKSCSLAEKVTLNLYPENPLRLDIILNENNGSFLFFYLAPKLSE